MQNLFNYSVFSFLAFFPALFFLISEISFNTIGIEIGRNKGV